MLWLMGRIPYPESTDSWRIAGLHPDASMPVIVKARVAMVRWVTVVKNASAGLRQEDAFEGVVMNLVSEDPNDRMTAAELGEKMKDLFANVAAEQ